VEPLTSEKAQELGHPELKAVVVTKVAPHSPAASIVSPGDVILSVNREKVTSVQSYHKLLAKAKKQPRALLHVLDARTGRTVYKLVPNK